VTVDDRNSLRNPWLAVTLLTVVAALCTALGFWQLGRAEQSRELLERYSAAGDMPSISRLLEEIAGADIAALRYRSVEAEGRYEPERQFLIDNIVRNGVPGYFVLTPFRRADANRLLIVNRGWIRADPDRSVLPGIDVSSERRRIVGRLDVLPAPGLRLGGEAPAVNADVSVRVLSYPAMSELERQLGRELFDYQLLLDPDQPGGFERAWRGPSVEPSRNLAYAGQWWLFAAVAGTAALIVARRALLRRSR
jgi:surfeit locus 1 family protein